MKKISWCVSLFLCSVFSYLPLIAAGGIPPGRTLRLRVPHTTPVHYSFRTRTPSLYPKPLVENAAQRKIAAVGLQNISSAVTMPTPAPSLTSPALTPFEDEDFPMADAVFERVKDRLYAKQMLPEPAPQKVFPPSQTMQAWQSHSFPPEVLKNFFLQETQQLANLAKTDQVHHNHLEGELFDLLCEWKKTSYWPEHTFAELQNSLFPHSLAARLRWPEDWAKSSQDTTRWPFVKPDEVMTDKPLTFQSDLVVLIVNDNEEIATSAFEQLRGYAGHIFRIYDLNELTLVIDQLKTQNLRPHYIVSDGAIGWNHSDKDIKLQLKQAFPEIAQEMGFIILSDGILDFYAQHNGYVSYLTRIEDHFKDLGRLIGGLEEKYHIQATIQQIP